MINKLVENIKKTGAPIVVGLDPMMKFIPEFITKRHLRNTEKRSKVLQKQSGSTIRESWMRSMIWFRQ